MNNINVSIIIINHNHGSLIRKNIQSIYKKTSKITFEVILINNTPRDSIIPDILRKFPKVKYIENISPKGFSENNNIGVEVSIGEKILILNPDTELKNNAIYKLYDYLYNNKKISACGAKLLNRDETVQFSCRKFPTAISTFLRRTPLRWLIREANRGTDHLMADWNHETTRQVDWILGACIMIDKKLMIEIGMFDTKYFLYCEDIDLCYRLKQSGYPIYYIHDAEIYHDHQRVSDKSFLSKRNIIHLKSMFYFIYKHGYLCKRAFYG